MPNPFAHFWLFIVAVLSHTITLLSGCAATVLIGVLEKRVLKKPISLKLEVGVFLLFVFFACFQAWKDQFDKADQAKMPLPTVTVNTPITVPPATVIIEPANSPPSSPTGFIQIDRIRPAMGAGIIENGKKLTFNLYYDNPGSAPVTDKYSVESVGLGETADPNAEAKLKKSFSEVKRKAREDIRSKHYAGDFIGVGKEVYKSASFDVTTQRDAILSGAMHIYVYIWATWKDSQNRVGNIDACYWLQKPSSQDLVATQMVWHGCAQK